MNVLGIMSGTSLDGVDLALCNISESGGKYSFKIIAANTYAYADGWEQKLKTAHELNPKKLEVLSALYGEYLAQTVLQFLKTTPTKPEIIASHGHTVLHQPEKGITLQIGNGPEIFNATGIPTVCDFRVQDVALGGQGAPLVPIGDELLFAEYDYCVNLGGFTNISFNQNQKRIAFDVSPLNIVMNEFALKLGKPYDENGDWARQGKIDQSVLKELNSIDFYQQNPPKSLGKEWVLKNIWPLVKYLTPKNGLRTILEHSAQQLAKALNSKGKVLLTGGGAFNNYFVEVLKTKTNCKIITPEREIIEFKEALVFALLGYLKWQGKNNCLASVTGAKKDHSSGVVWN